MCTVPFHAKTGSPQHSDAGACGRRLRPSALAALRGPGARLRHGCCLLAHIHVPDQAQGSGCLGERLRERALRQALAAAGRVRRRGARNGLQPTITIAVVLPLL